MVQHPHLVAAGVIPGSVMVVVMVVMLRGSSATHVAIASIVLLTGLLAVVASWQTLYVPLFTANYPMRPLPTPSPGEWTPRELEVLQLIAAGCSNDDIAAQLIIADSTVKTHINNLYRKLGVRSRTQALRRARELSLV